MPGYYPTSHKSGKARIATALPTGSRKTLHPSDNRHCASSAKNTHENRVAAIQRKAKTNTCDRERAISSHERGAISTHCLRIERG
jgi:hypothetical protein